MGKADMFNQFQVSASVLEYFREYFSQAALNEPAEDVAKETSSFVSQSVEKTCP